jgi:hypothetical protein
MTTHHNTYTEGDQEIMDTIRMYLYACYVNVEDGRDRTFARYLLRSVPYLLTS